MTLTHGELFAGVSGFGLGLERAGITTTWAVEIDPQCRRVLAAHHPTAALFEDVREVGAHNLTPVDIITFGSPCQDLSVAGKRKGFAGERSGLYHEAIRIIGELRPAIAVWENVPGALSSHSGRDFGAALDALADIGALDIAWAVLDAQWFGVPQRRRRVFVVADFGGERAAEILALADGLRGDSAPRRKAGERIADSLTVGANQYSGFPGEPVAHTLRAEGFDASEDGTGRGTPLIAFAQNQRDEVRDLNDVAGALASEPGMKQQTYVAIRTANTGANGHGVAADVAHTLDGANGQAVAVPILEAGARTNGDGYRDGDGIGADGDPMYTLQAAHQHAVAFTCKDSGQVAVAFTNRSYETDSYETLRAGSHGALPMVSQRMAVRRLTPTECARLQAFPDDWLDLDPPLSDSAKYRMLGNAVCVNVAAWLGERIAAALTAARQEAA